MAEDSIDEALATLAHEVRVDVLRELADAGRPLAFTDLKERVGVEDPGRFNYHLNELCRHFLQQCPEGYELTYRGERVLVAAGEGVEVVDRPLRGTEEPCPVCGDADCERLVHVHLEGAAEP